MQLRHLSFIFFILFATAAHANQTYTLMSRSTTGRTIVMNVGSLDGVRDSDHMAILKHIPKQGMEYNTELVAKARAIKVLNNRSIWFCYKIYKQDLLAKGEKYIFTTKEQLLLGRNQPTTKRKKLISEPGQSKKTLKDYFKGFNEDKLVNNDDRYEEGERISENKGHTEFDYEIIDLAKWEKQQGQLFDMMESSLLKGQRFRPKEIYTSPYQKEFLHRRNLDTYEKMIVNYLAKVNDPNFSYEKFYADQMVDKDSPYFKKSGIFQSTYLTITEERQREIQRKREHYRKLLAKGPDWSDEFSDRDLERLIYEKGVMDEEKRRRILISRRYTHQYTLSLGLNMVNNENVTDTTNTQDFKNSFDISWEYFLARRFPRMEHFTFELSARYNRDAYSVGSVNAVATEFSSAMGMSWYPFLKPNSIEENLFFIGAGYRYGRSNLVIDSLGEEGVYSVTSLPTFHGGVKYNFRSGFGIRLMFSYAKLNLTRIERNFVDTLPESVDGDDIKVTFGVSLYR